MAGGEQRNADPHQPADAAVAVGGQMEPFEPRGITGLEVWSGGIRLVAGAHDDLFGVREVAAPMALCGAKPSRTGQPTCGSRPTAGLSCAGSGGGKAASLQFWIMPCTTGPLDARTNWSPRSRRTGAASARGRPQQALPAQNSHARWRAARPPRAAWLGRCVGALPLTFLVAHLVALVGVAGGMVGQSRSRPCTMPPCHGRLLGRDPHSW